MSRTPFGNVCVNVMMHLDAPGGSIEIIKATSVKVHTEIQIKYSATSKSSALIVEVLNILLSVIVTLLL